jgi:hypothetical protein
LDRYASKDSKDGEENEGRQIQEDQTAEEEGWVKESHSKKALQASPTKMTATRQTISYERCNVAWYLNLHFLFVEEIPCLHLV